jgi:hypothetical protein
MQHWEKLHSEKVQGFDIDFSITYDETHPRDLFDDSIEDINELCDKIDRGVLTWFIAKVTASKNGIVLSDDYLGGCLYENAMDFVTDDYYYSDMKQTVIDEAKKAIQSLIN